MPPTRMATLGYQMKELLQNKKLVGVYLLWCTIHLLLFIISLGTNDIYYSGNAQKEFWPFTDESFGKSYDYIELALYTIIPVGIIIALHYLRSHDSQES